jgi:hypothetical protein
VFPLQGVADNTRLKFRCVNGPQHVYLSLRTDVSLLFLQSIYSKFWGKEKHIRENVFLHRFKCHFFFFVVVELHFVCNFLTEIYSISDFDPQSGFFCFFLFGHFPITSEKGIEREQSISLKVFEMRKVFFLFVCLSISMSFSMSFRVFLFVHLCLSKSHYIHQSMPG